MFVCSFRATQRQLVSLVGCGLLLAAALLTAVIWPAGGASTAAGASVAGDTGEERVAFLAQLGYVADAGTATVREIQIPDDFDETLMRYNELQKTAEMDLEPYRGRRVKCWTYPVQNVVLDGPVVANLYVYKGKVIGGDISSVNADGDSYGLVPLTSLPRS